MIQTLSNVYKSPAIKLGLLTDKSQKILFRAHIIFPLDLFPDCIVIDETKVSLIKHTFVKSEEVRNVLIEDISDVNINITMFLASLEIVNSSNQRFPIKLKLVNLRPKDAIKARKIIQGLIAAKRSKIELGEVNKDDVSYELQALGESQEEINIY